MSAKKFNAKTANLDELNRELKRLASRKCRAKTDDEKAAAAAEYEKIVAVKAERFATRKKSYMTFADAEIAQLDLETTVKAIKSLQSRRCQYPEKAAETVAAEIKFQKHREELLEKAKLEELMAKYAN